MKNRPQMQLIGHDGNIYAIMGTAAKLLRRSGMQEESDEMFRRVTSSGSYYEALGIISEYVQTELSVVDSGILEPDDICVNTEFTYDHNGITAYIETWFDVQQRFNPGISEDDSIDLYATVQPETGEFQSRIMIKRESTGEHECREIRLLPCERKLIIAEMEKISQEQTHQSLKEQFADWKAEYGDKQKNTPAKENQKHKYER